MIDDEGDIGDIVRRGTLGLTHDTARLLMRMRRVVLQARMVSLLNNSFPLLRAVDEWEKGFHPCLQFVGS